MPPGFPTIVRSNLWVWNGTFQKWIAAVVYDDKKIEEVSNWYRKKGFCICIVKRQAGEAKPCLS